MAVNDLVSNTIKGHAGYNSALIYRAQVGGVAFGLWPTALALTTLIDTAAAGRIKLPNTYESVGQLSEDGIEFEPDLSMVEVRGWGSKTVLRRDFESWDETFTFSMLEDKRIAYDLANGVDTTAVPMSAAGEWKHTRSGSPSTLYRRAVAFAQDFEGDQLVIKARAYHKVLLTDVGSQTWSSGDDPLMREVTFGADDDPAVGGPVTEFLLGPGAKAYAAARGITVASA